MIVLVCLPLRPNFLNDVVGCYVGYGALAGCETAHHKTVLSYLVRCKRLLTQWSVRSLVVSLGWSFISALLGLTVGTEFLLKISLRVYLSLKMRMPVLTRVALY